MNWNYDFCMASAVVLFVLIVYNYSAIEIKGITRKLYVYLLILSCACCITDMFSGMFLMQRLKNVIWINYIGEILYYSVQHAIPCCYFIYITVISRNLNVIDKRLLKCLIPGIIEQFLIYTTPLTGWMFTYDENGYARGPFMWILIVGTAFYLLLGFLGIMADRKNIERRYKVVSVIFLLLPAAAVVVQIMHIELILISSSIALSCLIMQLILQNTSIINEVNEKEIQARQVAEDANRAKSTFLANMSHEIRTPMNAICGMADILERSDIRPHEMEYVQTIQVAAKNLLGIIDDILDFSKVDAGKLDLCIVDYRIDEMLRNVENIIAARVYGKNIKFEINVKAGVPLYLNGDSAKIQQILINILGNAVKFTETGKIVLHVDWLGLPDEKVNIIFRITDTGIGIKKEDMEKLFNQFSQVDAMRNRKKGGTGLGLALSKGIANLMNGDITVVSEYGIGSTFTVNIEQKVTKCVEHHPELLKDYIVIIYEEDYDSRWHIIRILEQIGVKTVFIESSDRITYSEFAKYQQPKKIFLYNYDQLEALEIDIPDGVSAVAMIEYYAIMKKDKTIDAYIRKPYDIFKVYNTLFDNQSDVLKNRHKENIVITNVRAAVVDDNRVNLKVAATQLMEWKVLPETFTSGQAVLKALERGRQYDIIFMDHMMPELDGVETTIRIRAMEGNYFKNVPIIALTANAVEGVEREYKEAGMNDWLFKPIRLEQLRDKLIKYLPKEKVEVKEESGIS